MKILTNGEIGPKEMCLITDKKFINLIASSLERFAWKNSNLANCRCPYCGDSQRNKRKARGYFYAKNNDMFFRCHNCGIGTTIYKFLEFHTPNLVKEYSLERWKKGENGHSNYKKPEINLSFNKVKKTNTVLSDLVSVFDLEEEHICKEFVINRQIPKTHWKNLYYTENFCNLIDKYGKEPCNESFSKDERLVIPIFNEKKELIGLQGRTLSKSSIRYLTLKLIDEFDTAWFGIQNINTDETVYVVEGPIDSLFLPNCIAMIGLNTDKKIPTSVKNYVYVLDNEPRNKEVLSYYESVIKNNHNVVIWPENIKKKDINDMVMGGMNSDEILNIINSNTFQNMEAKIRFIKWKKI
jgi:hypothetical protein